MGGGGALSDGNMREYYLSFMVNPAAWNVVNELFRPNAVIGDGGTAAMLKYERKNGIKNEKGKYPHQQKAENRKSEIINTLNKQNLTQMERDILNKILMDLREALYGI